MISTVTGTVVARGADHVVVDTAGGVGYQLAVSTETLRGVPAEGERVSLLAHTIVREDLLALHGFSSEPERQLFLLLISVSGVGPKVAMAALSGGSVRDLLAALATGDAKRFQAVPGIGKRTAERIILELREKVAADLESGDDRPEPGSAGAGPRADAREGLLGLGFDPPEVERLLDRVDGETAEELIAAALGASSADRGAP
ncbi:MAG: Holliday junction branch migration protein RuvA [Solirubrobacterales bacterium]